MNKITTIIFDFGDVLIQDLVNVFEKKYGLSKLSKTKQKQYAEVLHLSEIGKIPTEKYLKTLSKLLAPKMKPEEIEKYFLTAKILPPYKLFLKLKETHPVAILTNNQKNWIEEFIKKTGINLENVWMFNSAKIGLRKPNPKIYAYALKKLGTKPSECIFIDDKPENLVPAKKLGINTILYKNNIIDLKNQLKKFGIIKLPA
jgi:epoxide hydrolase-like predicted phosphatase